MTARLFPAPTIGSCDSLCCKEPARTRVECDPFGGRLGGRIIGGVVLPRFTLLLCDGCLFNFKAQTGRRDL